ncbi:MAG: cation transporter [Proteobacteria bacterium]|nr:cation transporter [Pseudomonadota bacterium]MBU1686494.1 cation transporter [Pseudomonadota bacterium]
MATVKISGMRCGHCVGSVSKALSEIEGVSNVQVDLDKGQATYDEKQTVSKEVIKKAIADIGFEAE